MDHRTVNHRTVGRRRPGAPESRRRASRPRATLLCPGRPWRSGARGAGSDVEALPVKGSEGSPKEGTSALEGAGLEERDHRGRWGILALLMLETRSAWTGKRSIRWWGRCTSQPARGMPSGSRRTPCAESAAAIGCSWSITAARHSTGGRSSPPGSSRPAPRASVASATSATAMLASARQGHGRPASSPHAVGERSRRRHPR